MKGKEKASAAFALQLFEMFQGQSFGSTLKHSYYEWLPSTLEQQQNRHAASKSRLSHQKKL